MSWFASMRSVPVTSSVTVRFAIASLVLMAIASPCLGADPARAGGDAGRPTLGEKIKGLEPSIGLLDLFLDRSTGQVWLALPPAVARPEGVRLLYGDGIRAGLGSNPVGLDRGRLGPTRLVSFRRVGGKVLLEELNTRYRALTESAPESRAVRDSFATSVLWAGPIQAEDPGGRVLVDLTTFLASDVHGVTRLLESAGQGSFSLDTERSAVDPQGVLVFPRNVEVDAILTFSGARPGDHVRQTAPTPTSVTLVQHHSFVRLPDPGYRPRRLDPRVGSFGVSFHDYSAPLDEPLRKQWIVRHRLEKTDPSTTRSRVKEPIVYYVDSGIPEPVRSALVEGAGWWAEAFEEAGFLEAYRVELLPEGVHPLDARYNVIHWVHRSTRGWSYGGGMTDPRTGEMIKGNVRLGSLRVRQDRLLFEGLAGTGRTGSGAADDPVELALARLRQLAAHEVGHTLGFAHNFAASTYGRASVMDYPAPLVKIRSDGSLDLSKAYAVGVGEWDIHTVKYAYGQPPPGKDEDAFLQEIVDAWLRKGLPFITDPDARPAGAAQPAGNLWDNGEDPVAELDHLLEVRRIAMARFGEDGVKKGRPLSLLREVFLPLYFHHRYQLDAAAKVIGGMEYAYSVRGDGQPPALMIDPARQQAALGSILKALEPGFLDVEEGVLEVLLPRPFGHPPNRELLESRTGPAFDPMGAARAAASMAVAVLLQPERTARLVDFHRREPSQPGLEWLLAGLIQKTFRAPPVASPEAPRLAALSRVVRGAVVDGLLDLSAHPRVTTDVRAMVDLSLAGLQTRLENGHGGGFEDEAHNALLAARIGRYLERDLREAPAAPWTAHPPPGSPIGAGFLPPDLIGCSLEALP